MANILRNLGRRRGVLAVGIVGALVAAGAAYSQIPAADGTIWTCYTKSTGTIRIIDSGTSCKNGETSLTWNQRGPAGATGLTGATGPAGAAGAAGAAGPAGPTGAKGDTGPAGPAGAKGDTGPAGPAGPTGPPGPKGDTGPPGASLTAVPLENPDLCGGNGGLQVSTQGGTPVGVLCNGAAGAKGDTGPKGDPGTPGSGLVGSDCTIPGGSTGTVQMEVALNGDISFKCQASGGGTNLCPETPPTYPNAIVSCDSATGTISYVCVTGFIDGNGDSADGCEIDLSTDPLNCGSPGAAIPSPGTLNANWACVGGEAVITSCKSGFADGNLQTSDGCEINLSTDTKNCGSLGNAVPPGGNANYACVNGTIVLTSCFSGFANGNGLVSDGCEINLNTDPNNCGAVGRKIPVPGYLNANWACAAGQFVITSCVSGYFDANGSPVDGCEWHEDGYEPNDTQASAGNLGSHSPGSSLTVNANTTPGNDDWFVVTSADCSIFTGCTTQITVSGPVSTTILRGGSTPIGNGASDFTFTGAQYYVLVQGGYATYQIHYSNS